MKPLIAIACSTVADKVGSDLSLNGYMDYVYREYVAVIEDEKAPVIKSLS